MKLWSKEALILGGVYSVLDIPFSLLKFEFISSLLFVAFILYAILLCFNKTPKFITHILNNYPKTTYYLCSIGWIPYFIFLVLGGFLASGYFINYSPETIANILTSLTIGEFVLLFISLLISLIRKKKS